jgi:hypothetical protein
MIVCTVEDLRLEKEKGHGRQRVDLKKGGMSLHLYLAGGTERSTIGYTIRLFCFVFWS